VTDMTFRGIPFLRSAASMVAATALASLALPTTQASAVATGVHVRYDFGHHQNILEITGTDGDDEIFVEDGVGGVAVSIPFGTWLALDDSTGTCIRTMDNAVACPNTLELLDVTLGEAEISSRGSSRRLASPPCGWGRAGITSGSTAASDRRSRCMGRPGKTC